MILMLAFDVGFIFFILYAMTGNMDVDVYLVKRICYRNLICFCKSMIFYQINN